MDNPLRHRLEQMHAEAFGWAMCCCRRDRALAEEVLQHVYLKILQGTARYDEEGAFKPWLFAVIRRTAAGERRREWLCHLRLARNISRVSQPEPAPDGGDRLDLEQRQTDLLAALSALPPRQRQVLQLMFYHDMTLAQAAKVMGVALGSAATHYDRAKKAVRRHFEEKRRDESLPRSETVASLAG